MSFRIEKDFIGEVKIPSKAYYGSETQRTLDNFKISGMQINYEFIRAYVMLKKALAMTNMELGALDRKCGGAIVKACDKILEKDFTSQFKIDLFQAGAGTSTNMNVNEVIANVAIEMLHGKRGDYSIVHPNDHVNMSQSTNDTYHANIRLTSYILTRKKLLPALKDLEKSLRSKAMDFSRIVKTGRTHLQDAVPMSLGEEFSGYQGAVAKSIEIISHAQSLLSELQIGGTALGTGINTPKGYRKKAISTISKVFHARFSASEYMFTDMQSQIAELEFANSLALTAIAIGKISNDLRLLASGPRGGIGELLLPEIMPGSSIMPGKVNPSIPEMMNMVCFQVIGNCTAVREAANAGQLELNVFMPVIAFNLIFSIEILSNAVRAFSSRCIEGIKPNKERIRKNLEMNLSIVTALNPYIGYKKAAEIARIAYKKGKSIREVCMEMKVLDRNKLDKILNPKNLV